VAVKDVGRALKGGRDPDGVWGEGWTDGKVERKGAACYGVSYIKHLAPIDDPGAVRFDKPSHRSYKRPGDQCPLCVRSPLMPPQFPLWIAAQERCMDITPVYRYMHKRIVYTREVASSKRITPGSKRTEVPKRSERGNLGWESN